MIPIFKWLKVFRFGDAANDARKATKNSDNASPPVRCPGKSFVSGTLVVMADGSQKAIEDIKVGDRVLATDPKTSKTAPRRVIATSYGSKRLVTVTVDTDGSRGDVVATDNHPFWVDDQGRWINAADLNPGDHLRTTKGERATVTDTATRSEPRSVYNLTINGIHTYHVTTGETDVLVHNCGKRDRPTKNTRSWSAYYGSEREARALARRKVGRGAVEYEPHKWRSADGKWQYRAKPEDIAGNHIHLEELNPQTGEVLQNLHLRW